MCTAICFKTDDFYFGRTLDNDCSYGERIVITPRNYPLTFSENINLYPHYAIIGTALIQNSYPLYYDATNEKGLSMAGLNFIGNAKYSSQNKPEQYNIPQYALILWILSQCDSTENAIKLIKQTNITNLNFSKGLPSAELHWLIADKDKSVTLEATKDGLFIYENPVGILTNNPPFKEQMTRLIDYKHLSPHQPENTFSEKLELTDYSRGMGAIGLPGDLSSSSRFVRAAFTKLNSVCDNDELSSVNQFFHIMGAVEQTKGCCIFDKDKYEKTIYTSCCNTHKGIYYFRTYGNHRINAVDMNRENIEGSELIGFDFSRKEDINTIN